MYQTLIYKIISGMKNEIMTTFTLRKSIKHDIRHIFYIYFHNRRLAESFKQFADPPKLKNRIWH